MKKLFTLILFTFLVSFSDTFSQENESSKKASLTPEIIPIDYNNKIYITLDKESKMDSLPIDNNYILKLYSEKEFNCSNFEIVADVEISNTRIFISLFGIKSPVVCVNSEGAAVFQKRIFLFSGNYEVFLKYEDMRDKFGLKILGKKAYLEEEYTEFSKRGDD